MAFLENLKEFFSVAKETNFDLGQIYTQTPDGVYSVVLILVAILLVIVFFIRRSAKISSTVKLVSQIQNAKSFDEYNKFILDSSNDDYISSLLNLVKLKNLENCTKTDFEATYKIYNEYLKVKNKYN